MKLKDLVKKFKLDIDSKREWIIVDSVVGGHRQINNESGFAIPFMALEKLKNGKLWRIGNIEIKNEKKALQDFEEVKRFINNEKLDNSAYFRERYYYGSLNKEAVSDWIAKNGQNKYVGKSVWYDDAVKHLEDLVRSEKSEQEREKNLQESIRIQNIWDNKVLNRENADSVYYYIDKGVDGYYACLYHVDKDNVLSRKHEYFEGKSSSEIDKILSKREGLEKINIEGHFYFESSLAEQDVFGNKYLGKYQSEQAQKEQPLMIPSQVKGWSDWSINEIKNDEARKAAEWLLLNKYDNEQDVKDAFYYRQTSSMSDDFHAYEKDEINIIEIAKKYQNKLPSNGEKSSTLKSMQAGAKKVNSDLKKGQINQNAPVMKNGNFMG